MTTTIGTFFYPPDILHMFDWYGEDGALAVVNMFKQGSSSDPYTALEALVDMCVYPKRAPLPFVISATKEGKTMDVWSGPDEEYKVVSGDRVRETIVRYIDDKVAYKLDDPELHVPLLAKKNIIVFAEKIGSVLGMEMLIEVVNNRFGESIKLQSDKKTHAATKQRAERMRTISLHLYNRRKMAKDKHEAYEKELDKQKKVRMLDGFMLRLAEHTGPSEFESGSDLFNLYTQLCGDDDGAFTDAARFARHLSLFNVEATNKDVGDMRKVFIVNGKNRNKTNKYRIDSFRLGEFARSQTEGKKTTTTPITITKSLSVDRISKTVKSVAAILNNVCEELPHDAKERRSQAWGVVNNGMVYVGTDADAYIEALTHALLTEYGVEFEYDVETSRVTRLDARCLLLR